MIKVYEIEESWTSLDQRLKAVGLVIEVGKEDWIEDIVSHLEAVHKRVEDLEAALDLAVKAFVAIEKARKE